MILKKFFLGGDDTKISFKKYTKKYKINILLVFIVISILTGCIQPSYKNIQQGEKISWANPPTNSIQHVVVILFENQELNNILNNGPYFNYLYKTYGAATNYYAPCHPSTSNYLAITSGNTWQCGSDSINLYNTTNLGTILQNKNLSWYAFMESMTNPCSRDNYGEYLARHNPFVYYSDLVNSNVCKDHDIPLSVWDDLVKKGDAKDAKIIPAFSFISPNKLNDGHDTDVKYADNWLKNFLNPILAKPWFNNTVIFIVFDESDSSDKAGFDEFNGGHTYLVAVSPFSKGKKVSNNVTAYNLLSTIEWLLDLKTTGTNDNTYPPIRELFDFPRKTNI